MHNFSDLSKKSYNSNRFTFTDFLSLSEFSDLESEKGDFLEKCYESWGGYADAERVVVRFGSVDELGYEEEFPISIVRIDLAAPKFATKINHRDYLGSLMGLGLERRCFGDIICDEKGAYVFVHNRVIDTVMRELTAVGRNTISMKIVDELPEDYMQTRTKTQIVQVASMRADGIIAHVCKLSRKDVILLFQEKKVSVNGRLVENNDKQLVEGDAIAVRGFGKFKIAREAGLSRKGKCNLEIEVFI